MSTGRVPVCMLLHPVGVGATRAMNVLSAKLWLRALVDAVPDASFDASWLPYAEAMVDRERGIRDALAVLDRCDAAVAVGGEFSRGMLAEWERAAERRLCQIDLTQRPMPSILTYETFAETRAPSFQTRIAEAFATMIARSGRGDAALGTACGGKHPAPACDDPRCWIARPEIWKPTRRTGGPT